MRYLCSIYTHGEATGGAGCGNPANDPSGNGPLADGPAPDGPLVRVVVDGADGRDAAAGAYVRSIGRERARWMRSQPWSSGEVVAHEASQRAIAASLRRLHGRLGDCFELDFFACAWLIKVEPAPAAPMKPNRLRLSPRLFRHLCRTPFPN